jgi:hypothetical protein
MQYTITTTYRNLNHQIAEQVFDLMRKYGFKPYNIEYGNSYFIFEGEDDSVVHFRVKGVWKHWKFGMWINSEYLAKEELDREANINPPWKEGNKVVRLFAQYDTCIDKFKPSRSELLVEMEARNYEEDREDWYELRNMLQMMRRHPFMCYCGFCGDHAGYWGDSFVAQFIKYEGQHTIKTIKKHIALPFWYLYTKAKIFFASMSKHVTSVTMRDFEKDNPGWKTSYRYSVHVVFAADATENQECTWLNHWFKKRKYGKYDYFDYAVKLDNCFQKDGQDEPYSYSYHKKWGDDE